MWHKKEEAKEKGIRLYTHMRTHIRRMDPNRAFFALSFHLWFREEKEKERKKRNCPVIKKKRLDPLAELAEQEQNKQKEKGQKEKHPPRHSSKRYWCALLLDDSALHGS